MFVHGGQSQVKVGVVISTGNTVRVQAKAGEDLGVQYTEDNISKYKERNKCLRAVLFGKA